MDNLLGVCGLTESTCGESMFSKVTNLFGANTTDASDDVDCEDEQHDRTTSTNEANGKSEEIDATNQKPMGSSPASPKQSPIEVDGLPATPALPNSPQRPKSPKSSDSQPLEEKVQEGGKLKNIIKKRSNWFTRKGKEKDDSPNVAHTVSPFGSEKSVENEEDNDDGDDGDDEDVHALLANLEIPDFDMSLEHDDDDKVGSLPGGQKPWEVVDWKERINREEVFSKLYKPKRSEVQELYAMSNTLGVAKSTGILRSIGMVSKGTQDIQTLLSGEHSILMANFRVMHGEVAYHMLLFNDGFILKNQSVNYFNPLEKRYEACHLWNDVDFVERVNASEITVQIVDGTKTYELSSADEEVSLETIFKCLERIIISNEIFDGTSNRKETLGWQYLRVRKPAFTAAVMNDPTILDGKHEIMAESINDLDEYNQHAPLHYAVLHEECNLDVIRRLLKAGAKPNLEDGEGRNAMYYAERHGLPGDIVEALASAGGKKSKLAETELRGELFSRVDGANYRSERRRERERIAKENEQSIRDQKAAEAQQKAESAQSEMSKAMSALIERGEKIEALDRKTKDLEAEAKTFGDLAARLKDEVASKKWYQL